LKFFQVEVFRYCHVAVCANVKSRYMLKCLSRDVFEIQSNVKTHRMHAKA